MAGLDPHTLDCCWIAVNACGGVPANEAERLQCEGLGEALDVIERLGGMDPQQRARRNEAVCDDLDVRIGNLVRSEDSAGRIGRERGDSPRGPANHD